jgi:ribosomal RNA-processing protein 17
MGPQAKKRKLTPKVEEINFDPADRQEFLTGFRKRKQQRIRHAQELAAERAREEKRLERKKVCTPLGSTAWMMSKSMLT